MRTPGLTPAGKRRLPIQEEEDDLTKDMEDPVPEPNIQEVTIPRIIPNVKSNRDSELLPIKGGVMMDIEEEAEVSQLHSFPIKAKNKCFYCFFYFFIFCIANSSFCFSSICFMSFHA